MTTDDTRTKLVKLGADALADALLTLSERDEIAEEMIERMVSTPVERVRRFKSRIAGLKRGRKFYHWNMIDELAQKLESMLKDIEGAEIDPCLGAELIIAFFKTDDVVFEHCDDSSGRVGDIYRFSAKRLFKHYAQQCEKKDLLVKVLVEYYQKDDYGIRDALIDCAAEYLEETHSRELIAAFQEQVQQSDERQAGHYYLVIESLAHQIKDAQLFEQTRRAHWGKLPTAACVDIGEVYLESGDASTALDWLNRIDPNERFMFDRREKLLLEIHEALGNQEKVTEIAWRMFHSYRSKDNLERLLHCIGNDKRDVVIDDEISTIHKMERFNASDVNFMIEQGRSEEASRYIVARTGQIPGEFYDWLLSVAEAMQTGGYPLAATVVYRALLDDILDSSRTRAYGHAAKYLKTLDGLSTQITDWQDVPPHVAYASTLQEKHGKKRSFWSRYE